MVEFVFGQTGQEEDILDFANYVFSMVRCPIDFKHLLPKVYARPGFAPLHALAMEQGRIKGTLALLPGVLDVRGVGRLQTGYLGTMAVHPYARGGGLMRTLMDMIVSRGEAMGLDVLALGGRRHRYNYFGFERGGALLSFTLNADCLKHALHAVDESPVELVKPADMTKEDRAQAEAAYQALAIKGQRDDLMLALQSWGAEPMAVRLSGKPAGYLCMQGNCITETALPDEAVLPVYKKCLVDLAGQDMKVLVFQHEPARIDLMHGVSENYTVSDQQMIRVLNWPRVLKTLLTFKHGFAPLEDGRTVLEIENAGRLCIAVQGGNVSVEKTEEEPSVRLSHNEAVARLFSPLTLMRPSSVPFNWLPLPFTIPNADQF